MLLNLYWILALCFVGLVFLTYLYNPIQPPPVKPWPLLSHSNKEVEAIPKNCSTHADCPKKYACLDNECIPRLVRGETEKCDIETGQLKAVDVRGKKFAVCICLYPNLVTQKQFGGNCDVQVACGPHGNYNLNRKDCDCDSGYVPVPGQYDCQKLPVMQSINLWPCEPDEVEQRDIKDEDGFHEKYLLLHRDKKCFKRPCTFDLFTGRPLKAARFEEDYGCVCEPTLGQFGVRVTELQDYVRGPGYNACGSIFEKNDIEVDVDAYAYYYLMDRLPVTWLAFQNLDQRQVNPLFQNKNGVVMVGQEFPFDYMQYHLQTKKPFLMRSRAYRTSLSRYASKFNMDKLINYVYNCDELKHQGHQFNYFPGTTSEGYILLYLSPLCYNRTDDYPNLKNKFVLSPYHMTYNKVPELSRTNGIVMRWRREMKGWRVELSEPYNLEIYLALNE